MKKAILFIFLAIMLAQFASSQEYKSFKTNIVVDIDGYSQVTHEITLDTSQMESITIPVYSPEALDANDGTPNVNFAVKDGEMIINPQKTSNYHLKITYITSALTTKSDGWKFSYYQKTDEIVQIDLPHTSSIYSIRPETINTINQQSNIYESGLENVGILEIEYRLGRTLPNQQYYILFWSVILLSIFTLILIIIAIYQWLERNKAEKGRKKAEEKSKYKDTKLRIAEEEGKKAKGKVRIEKRKVKEDAIINAFKGLNKGLKEDGINDMTIIISILPDLDENVSVYHDVIRSGLNTKVTDEFIEINKKINKKAGNLPTDPDSIIGKVRTAITRTTNKLIVPLSNDKNCYFEINKDSPLSILTNDKDMFNKLRKKIKKIYTYEKNKYIKSQIENINNPNKKKKITEIMKEENDKSNGGVDDQ